MSNHNRPYQSLKEDSILGTGADYLEGLYEEMTSTTRVLGEDRQSDWHHFFEVGAEVDMAANRSALNLSKVRQQFVNLTGRTLVASQQTGDSKQSKVTDLINSYRTRGHELADIDPLKMRDQKNIIEMTLEGHGLSGADLSQTFEGGVLFANQKASLADIVARLKQVYCGSIGVEYMHIANTTQKEWIRHRIEGSYNGFGISDDRKHWLLNKLTAAESLEKYLHTQYVGQKRFSLEGGESLIVSLAAIVEQAGMSKINEMVIGMAHRGRLNVLVNIFGKLPLDLFEEFEGKVEQDLLAGDVKYHQGFSSDLEVNGHPMHLVLAFNPSHLEIVGPVVVGSVKARQDREHDTDQLGVLPVIIHGDASFAGQGVVMEMLNMSESRGYSTKGSVHLIVNNQIGFTTSSVSDSRSTMYCTDVGKMLNIPILHVNGDDPEAVYFATQLAFDYRQTFKKDVIIDVVCYRRHGHNEADEPAVTQPVMYSIIRKLPTTRTLYQQKLEQEKVISDTQSTQMQSEYRERLKKDMPVADYFSDKPLQSSWKEDWKLYVQSSDTLDTIIDTGVEMSVLQQLG